MSYLIYISDNGNEVGKLLLFHEVVFERDKESSVTLKLDRIVLNKANDELFIIPEQILKLQGTK